MTKPNVTCSIKKADHDFAINELRKSMTNHQKFINGELLIPAEFALGAFDTLREELRLLVNYDQT